MTRKDPLLVYKEKRDFTSSPEPAGGGPAPEAAWVFVIQKHQATRLHYDFRLAADGVLKSWALPKGPSTSPRDKRLAVQVEDHPLDYANFEGVIPAGYGAGTVMIWDEGTHRSLPGKEGHDVSIAEGIARGHLDFWLEGKKLHGGYALVRLPDETKRNWLLIKMDDAHANPGDITASAPISARTGRTMDQITAQGTVR